MAIYSFPKAMLDDLKSALEKLKISYKEIKEIDIRNGALKNFSVLLTPGGVTLSLIKSLSKKSQKNIREFVKGGGGYVGICAGALVTPKKVAIDYIEENFSGLNIIDIKNIKEERDLEKIRTIAKKR